MKAIIKKDGLACEHEKPHPKAKLGLFPVWQERTLSIAEFDKKFGDREGLWKSQGKNHKDIICRDEGCYAYVNGGHKHCLRQVSSKKYWFINFKTLKEFERFAKDIGYLTIHLENQDGKGITITQ